MAQKDNMQELSSIELQERLSRLNRELFLLRDELAVHRKLEKPHLLSAKRKEKARVLTILTQKERSGVAVR